MKTSAYQVRRALMTSVCFPAAVLSATQAAHADQVVTVDAPTTAASVNADIAGKIATPDRNIEVIVTSTGAVISPGNVTLSPSAGRGDGTVRFSNAGLMGTVDANNTVTDFVGVRFFGQPLADNNLTGTNAGLISNGVQIQNFGGTVTFANSGAILGGISATSAGNVALTTSGVGGVGSGTVSGTSNAASTSTVDGAVTTTTFTSGNVTIAQVNVGSKLARGNVLGSSSATTDVAVAGIAGIVQAQSGGNTVTTSQAAAAPEAGKTVTTFANSTTRSGGAANITLGEASDISQALAQAVGGATVTGAGKVASSVQAQTIGTNSSNSATETQDADGNTTQTTSASTSAPAGGAATITLADSADIGTFVTASGAGGATVTVDGLVGGSVTADARASKSTNMQEFNYDKTGVLISQRFANTGTSAGGVAAITVGADAEIGGFADALGNQGATVSVAGQVGSYARAATSGTNTTGSDLYTYDADGNFVSGTYTDTSTTLGGAATGTVLDTGELESGLFVSSNRGDATASGAGKAASISVTSTGTDSASTIGETYDANGNRLTYTTDNTSTFVGGKAAATVASTGSISGSVSASGAGGATTNIAGAVTGATSATSVGSNSASVSSDTRTYDTDDSLLTYVFSSKSVTTSVGQTADISVAEGGSTGSATANGTAGATVNVLGSVGGMASANSAGSTSTEATSSGSQTYDKDGVQLAGANANATVRTAAGQMAAVTIAENGKAGSARADGLTGASVSNSGTIATSATAVSNEFLVNLDEIANSYKFTKTDASSETVFTDSQSYKQGQTGGIATVTNTAIGLIGSSSGSVSVDGIGGATVVNDGTVRGTTSAQSTGDAYAYDYSSTSTTTTVFGTAPALDVTTQTSSYTQTTSDTQVGNSVTGTYAGTNGTLNFTPSANGSITQFADKDSTATVSGGVFGNLQSTAGQGSSSTSESAGTFASVLNTEDTGTVSASNTSASSSTTSPGSSTVVVTGQVGQGNTGSGGTVTSSGTLASTVEIDGGTVEQNVTVSAGGIFASSSSSSESYDQVVTEGKYVTSALTASSDSKSIVTGGAASAVLTDDGTIGSQLSVTGISGATVTTAADTEIGGSVTVQAGYASDTSSSTTQSFTRDGTTGLASSSSKTVSAGTLAAAAGAASASIAGSVDGSLNVFSATKDATATVTGSVAGQVNAQATSQSSESTTTTTFDGKLPASAGTTFGSLGIPTPGSVIPSGGELVVTTNSSSTATGGRATVVIDTAGDLQDDGVAGAGSVYAAGLAGTTVDISAGSRVAGDATAVSSYANSTTEEMRTYLPTTANLMRTTTSTTVGGPVTVTNKGTVDGRITIVSPFGATLANTSESGGVSLVALGADTTTVVTDTNFTNAALRTEVTTVTTTPVGGTAALTNAPGVVIDGNVALAGKTGTFANNGFVTGDTTLGQGVLSGTSTTTRTDGSTTFEFEPTLFAQTYTVDNNGWSGGYRVTGAEVDVFNPETADFDTVLTGDITATINLNNGSVTLGDIFADVDEDGERLTTTTVNLNGSGFLGVDQLANLPPEVGPFTPSLTASEEAQDAFGDVSRTAISIRGVETLNKLGAGTFVINGTPLSDPSTPGIVPVYTLDVGQFNILGGEVQLNVPGGSSTYATASDKPVFGIRGDLNNSGILVVGRRVPIPQQPFGDNLVGIGGQRIAGITVEQTGNFTQAAPGVLVVGVSPSLVRYSDVSLTPGGTASEPLGPVLGGVSLPYFTTPAIAGPSSSPSRINVDGNFNLGGTVNAVVTRDSLFRNGDGDTIISYTGTGAVTATVTSSIPSNFISFTLVNDTTAKTVRLSASRSGYEAAASTTNGAAAAAALSGSVNGVVDSILADANGSGTFGSVAELAQAQDMANIISALDWRLSTEQAGQLFDELGSASIYGSLAAIDQNLVFGHALYRLARQRSAGNALTTGLWLNPVGDFAKYGGSSTDGASGIRSTAYGLAFGADVAVSDTAAFGIGGAYAEHDVTGRGTSESARVRTWTVGLYGTYSFDQIYLNAQAAYGFSRFNVDRSLEMLARSFESSFRGTQFDASLEGGYDFDLGDFVATPFAKVAIRNWTMNEASEATVGTGGGFGVIVEDSSKSVFSPTIGARIAGTFGATSGVEIVPHALISYTFQGDVGNARTVRYTGGGDSFELRGINPDGFGTIEVGVDTKVNNRFNLFVDAGYHFGGVDAFSIGGGIRFQF